MVSDNRREQESFQAFSTLNKIEYAHHPLSKFSGDIGILERKHVHADSVTYIRKEANNIDEQELGVKHTREFINAKWILGQILHLPQKVAEECGVDRKTFQTIKKAIREALRKD